MLQPPLEWDEEPARASRVAAPFEESSLTPSFCTSALGAVHVKDREAPSPWAPRSMLFQDMVESPHLAGAWVWRGSVVDLAASTRPRSRFCDGAGCTRKPS